MRKDTTDIEDQIIQQLILDRWNPHRIDHKIANHFGLTLEKVRKIRANEAFQIEHERQLRTFDGATRVLDIKGQRRRLKALQGLYYRVPDKRVALKLKILAQIRRGS